MKTIVTAIAVFLLICITGYTQNSTPRALLTEKIIDEIIGEASGSNNADVTAELVWVGDGRQADIEEAGVEGKIVVTSGSIAMVHSLAVAKGALGVISYNSPRPIEAPQIMRYSMTGEYRCPG